MRYSSIISIFALLFIASAALANEGKPAREVRTYLPYTYPLDPAKIQMLPDLALSNALASSLVEWDDEKEITSCIAKSWKIVSPKVYRFTLSRSARWSDGTPIRPADVKESIERSLKLHAHDLKGITEMIESIAVASEFEIDFRLKVPAKSTDLPEKLAKPHFGIINIGRNGQLNLSVSSGPYTLDPSSNQNELSLKFNPYWIKRTQPSLSPNKIIIRRNPKGTDPSTILFKDSWANLMEVLSPQLPETEKTYFGGNFVSKKSPLNHLFFIQFGKRLANEKGQALIRYLRESFDPKDITSGFTSYPIADQIFPKGFLLHNPQHACPKMQRPTLPLEFRHRPIEVLVSPSRVSPRLRQNLERVLTRTLGISPKIISLELNEVYPRMVRGDFDLYVGSITISDPDPEEMANFYFEGEIPLIFPNGNNYVSRLHALRKKTSEVEKLSETRSILSEALCQGNLIPLFYLSTQIYARPELDLSDLPESDETLNLSKIKFKEAQ